MSKISFNNSYLVILDGNQLVMSSADKRSCLRKCLFLARSRFNYVELWYQDGEAHCTLINYWN